MNKHYKKLLYRGLFEVGDKLVSDQHLKEDFGIEYVEITGVNYNTKIYYWQAAMNWDGVFVGLMISGTPFHCAEKYTPTNNFSANSPING